MVLSESVSAYGDLPSDEILDLLGGKLPARWGRMDRLSRAVAVHVGMVLRDIPLEMKDGEWGLICGTRYGCLETDLAFKASMSHDASMASPLLFSYTLPNIGLSEAASIFRIIGPVYVVYDLDSPFETARENASMWLSTDLFSGSIIYGAIDFFNKNLDVRLDIMR